MKLVSEVPNNYLKYQLCGVAGIFILGVGRRNQRSGTGLDTSFVLRYILRSEHGQIR